MPYGTILALVLQQFKILVPNLIGLLPLKTQHSLSVTSGYGFSVDYYKQPRMNFFDCLIQRKPEITEERESEKI